MRAALMGAHGDGPDPNIGEQQTRSGRLHLPDHAFQQSLTTTTSNSGCFQQQPSFAGNGAIFGPPPPARRSHLGNYSLAAPGPVIPQDDWNVGAQQRSNRLVGSQFSAYGQNLMVLVFPGTASLYVDDLVDLTYEFLAVDRLDILNIITAFVIEHFAAEKAGKPLLV
ncbi:hypothetical protein V498_10717 [Pseudogymnoascus sp. VKM F-4517 (FW-2822)]|nr:hypothetical protein V498_10717 [Pseudogymnoascus sp. VKM F-4517 (FW-2822)]